MSKNFIIDLDAYNAYYRTYKADYCRNTGLPLFPYDNNYGPVSNTYISKSRLKKDFKYTVSDNTGLCGWYMLQNGYSPLYDLKVLKPLLKTDLITFDQAAEMFNLSLDDILSLIKSEILPIAEIDGVKLIPDHKIKNYLKKNMKG